MCDVCGQTPCSRRCPNYVPENPRHKCFICGEEIYPGEEYIENFYGDLAHWDCIDGMRDLAEFLDIEIKEMEEDDDEEDY